MVKGFRALTRPPSLQEQYRETPFFVENYYLEQFTTRKPRAPLAHFHDVGWRRNLNPSPFFDVAFYLEDNEDVRRAGINPLVHYLDFGWKEGRMPHPNFDARGFLWAHPDIDRSTDPAAECLRLYGTLFWRSASVDGKPAPESERKTTVGQPGARAGRVGGLKNIQQRIARVFLPTSGKAHGDNLGGALAPGPLPSGHRLELEGLRGNHVDGWAWSSGEDDARLRVELWCGEVFIGHSQRCIRRPDVDKQLDAKGGTKGFLLPAGSVTALGQLLGGEGGGLRPTVRFGDQVRSLVTASPAVRDLASFRTLRAMDGVSGWRVVDLWWANSRLLKLRTGSHAGETGGPSASLLRVYQPLPQSGGLSLVLVDELPLAAETSIAAVGLRHPLMPILLVGCDESGEILFTDLIPFPSLLRGGLHEAEVAAVGEEGGTLRDFCRLSDAYLAEAVGWGQEGLSHAIAEIEVDLVGATGGEAIFDPTVGTWLSASFAVALAAGNVEVRVERDGGDRSFVDHAVAQLGRTQSGVLRAGRSRLSLPSRGIPSVGIVVSRRLSAPPNQQPGPHIVTDDALPDRRYLVAFPGGLPQALYPEHGGLGEMPYLTDLGLAAPGDDCSDDHIQPIAIVFRDLNPRRTEALKVFPVAKDQPLVIATPPRAVAVKVSVIIAMLRPDPAFELLLSTVAAQATSVACEVVLAVANHAAGQVAQLRATLEAVLPQRGQVIEVEGALNTSEALNLAAGAAVGEVLLFLDSSVILHDHRTVETLARIACLKGIGTVGCLQLRSREAGNGVPVFGSAGYFPARVDFSIAPHVGVSELDCSEILSTAIYPVVANSPRCFAVSTAAWRRIGGLSRQRPNSLAEIDLAVRLAEAGHVSVCTTLISVFTDAESGLRRLTDLQAPTNLTLWRILPALKASTLIRAF